MHIISLGNMRNRNPSLIDTSGRGEFKEIEEIL